MKVWMLLTLCAGNCLNHHSENIPLIYQSQVACENESLNYGYDVITQDTDPLKCGVSGDSMFITCPAIVSLPHSVPPYVKYEVCAPFYLDMDYK